MHTLLGGVGFPDLTIPMLLIVLVCIGFAIAWLLTMPEEEAEKKLGKKGK